MGGLRFIKSMESLINPQTLSPGFYERISTAYLVTLLRQKTTNQPCFFLSFVYKLFVTGYLKKSIMYLENCEMESRENVLQMCFITLML